MIVGLDSAAEGLLVLRDGEPGEPGARCRLRYAYQHRAEIKAVVQGTHRDTGFDALRQHRRGARRQPPTLDGPWGDRATR
jgi:hypothetical protein